MLQPPSENGPPAPLNPNVCAAYAEVHCISNFSFLQGASHPEELVMRAAALGYSAIAITDCSSVSGVVRAHVAAKQAGIHLLVGATIEPVGMAPLVLWSIADAWLPARRKRLLSPRVGRCGSVCRRSYGRNAADGGRKYNTAKHTDSA